MTVVTLFIEQMTRRDAPGESKINKGKAELQ